MARSLRWHCCFSRMISRTLFIEILRIGIVVLRLIHYQRRHANKQARNVLGKNADRRTKVAGFVRNTWQFSTGMGGRLHPEQVAGLDRNTHFIRQS